MPRPAPIACELAAVPEFGVFLATSPLMARAPRGHGGRVLVIPGFTAGDLATTPLRATLRALGHRPSGWGLGANVGPNDLTVRQLQRKVDEMVDQNDGPIDIVGWSLGGVMGRLLAAHRPEDVNQVITLGSPIHLDDPATRITDTVRVLAHVAGLQPNERRYSIRRIPVPSTVIYSRGDGVVAPSSTHQEPGPTAENIEVRGSHIGLVHNPAVLWVVADRLAQEPGTWTPFRPPRGMGRLYPLIESGTPDDPLEPAVGS